MPTEEYLRKLIRLNNHPVQIKQREYAEANYVPVLLPESANIIQMMTLIGKPGRILEIGTAIGYSGLLMLLNSPGSQLVTIEMDEDTLNIAKGFFSEAGVSHRVTAHLGDAKEIVPMLSGEYDLIFLDGPKSSYIEFLPFLYRMLSYGGMLICDNVLFKGWIAGENTPPKHKHNTIIKNMDLFCRTISDYKNLVTTILPIGDGMSISYKAEKNKE